MNSTGIIESGLLALTFAFQGTQPTFKFAKDQRVYVVAAETSSRNLNVTSANLELERLAKNQFKKGRAFRLTNTLRDADFVFFVLLDADSANSDEVALVVAPADYERASRSLDALRNAALWQADGHYKRGRHAALAGATIGLSTIFDRSGVVQGLVKRFHHDVLR